MASPGPGPWILVGISGVTCGGKTSLANRLKEALSPVYVFHQDAYFYPDDSPEHVQCAGLDHNNYDVLSALDMRRMHEDVVRTVRGPSGGFLVMEGFTVLNYKPLLELCNLRYYMVLEYSECAARRALRLYEPPDVAGYFERCVWPEHCRYRNQIEQDHRVKFLDGSKSDAFDIVMDDIRSLLAHT